MRFTIRDLLWLTLLAAVLVAWWVDRGRLAAQLMPFRGQDLRFYGTLYRDHDLIDLAFI